VRGKLDGAAGLLVRHREDAVPAERRLIEEVFLATFPASARGAVVGPLVEDDLEGFLGVFPPALAIELTGLMEKLEAVANFLRSTV
jgi:hypothetical protein